MYVEGSETSIKLNTNAAVPQGSHVGPLLFLLCTTDLTEISSDLMTKQLTYADDTKFFMAVSSQQECQQVQIALDRSNKWIKDNKIRINPSKTLHVSF